MAMDISRYAADRETAFLAADGSMMCEKHPGQEWGTCEGGPDCAGPGMPWVLEGRTLIEEVLARSDPRAETDVITADDALAMLHEQCPQHPEKRLELVCIDCLESRAELDLDERMREVGARQDGGPNNG